MRVYTRAEIQKIVTKLSDLQLSVLKAEKTKNCNLVDDLSDGIRDIVITFAGQEGLGMYSTMVLDFLLSDGQ